MSLPWRPSRERSQICPLAVGLAVEGDGASLKMSRPTPRSRSLASDTVTFFAGDESISPRKASALGAQAGSSVCFSPSLKIALPACWVRAILRATATPSSVTSAHGEERLDPAAAPEDSTLRGGIGAQVPAAMANEIRSTRASLPPPTRSPRSRHAVRRSFMSRVFGSTRAMESSTGSASMTGAGFAATGAATSSSVPKQKEDFALCLISAYAFSFGASAAEAFGDAAVVGATASWTVARGSRVSVMADTVARFGALEECSPNLTRRYRVSRGNVSTGFGVSENFVTQSCRNQF